MILSFRPRENADWQHDRLSSGEINKNMGRLRRSRVHKNIKDFKKKCRTRKRTKDLDQIHEDLKERNSTEIQMKSGVTDVDDLPGGGQYYCIHCALVLNAICGGYSLTFSEVDKKFFTKDSSKLLFSAY